MVDVLGTAASVITIVAVVVELIKHVKTFYRAQTEFGVLQEQLEHFAALLEHIDSHDAAFDSPIIATIVSRASSTLEQLHGIIKVKILQNVNGTKRARRRAWTKNKSKICSILDTLKDCRETLSAAIGANNLYTAKRSETMLSVINHDLERSKESTLSIDRRLSEMHQSLVNTEQAVLSLPAAFHDVLQSTKPYNKQLQSLVGSSPSLWYPGSSFSESQVRAFRLQSHLRPLPNKTILASTCKDDKESQIEGEDGTDAILRFLRSSVARRPASILEASPSLFPETLTTDQRIRASSLFITNSNETHCSIRSRTNYYEVLYLKSPRSWSIIDLSIEVSSSSTYWTATKLFQHRALPPGGTRIGFVWPFPQSLLDQIKEYLSALRIQEENAPVRLWLGANQIEKHQLQMIKTSFESSLMVNKQQNITQSMFAFLEDLGCKRYVDSQVIQIESIETVGAFASLVDGKLVYEITFARNCPSYKDLYNIKVLRGMDGGQGFAQLVGIVVDRSETYLKSYLVAIPQSEFRTITDGVRSTSVSSWERREHLARQVVEGVRQLHSRSFVIGTLWRARPPIFLDSSDCVHIWSFDKQLSLGTSRSGWCPPEYAYFREYHSSVNGVEYPDITSKADIFFLGTTLWYLAMEYPLRKISQVPAGDSQTLPQMFEIAFASGDGPSELPRLPDSVPKYYRDMIDACRAEDPNDRPAAWRLLKHYFPPRTESARPKSEVPCLDRIHLSLNSMRKAFKRWIWCGECVVSIEGQFLLCNVCQGGDWDICPKCYKKGLHCFEAGHLLLEMETTEYKGLVNLSRYHSITKGSGVREITEL